MTSKYVNVKVNISNSQKASIKRAVQSGEGISIKLSYEDLVGEHMLSLTNAQVNRMTKAYQNGSGITIKMSKAQVNYNMKVEGGFLPAILGFLASTVAPFLLKTALPALATGALSGLASTGISKALGSGVVYVKKGGHSYKVSTQGTGLWLRPYNGNKLDRVGEGLFLKTGSGIIDGRGLILGPNSPVSSALSNIPLLGPLISMIL